MASLGKPKTQETEKIHQTHLATPYSSGIRAARYERPLAPAISQDCLSSLANLRDKSKLGVQPSKTHLFRSFHVVHAPKAASELRPLPRRLVAIPEICSHQVMKDECPGWGARL
jgi:hypothetical protein